MRIHLCVIPMLSCLAIQAMACEIGEADRLYRTYDAAYLSMKSHDDEFITEYMSEQAKEAFRKGVELRNAAIRGDDTSWTFPAGADRSKNLLMLLQAFRGRVPENAKSTVSGDEGKVKIEYRWSAESLYQIRKGDFVNNVSSHVRDVELICRDKWLVNHEDERSESVDKHLDNGVVKSESAGAKGEWHFPP